MGFYDRDYYRNTPPRGGFGHFVAWSVTTWLIVINVAVFFADVAIGRISRAPESVSVQDDQEDGLRPPAAVTKPLTEWGAFSIETAIRHGQIWRFITFQFLHAEPWHLIGNMFGLYFFGPIVEGQFGSRRFLAFYLLCGLAGVASFVGMWACNVLNVHPATPMVGASAGIFGLLVASAMTAPDVQVFYYLMPVTILMLAVVGMLLAAYTVLAAGWNAGGESAHLGGGMLGFVLMKNQHWLSPFAPRQRPSMAPRRRVRAAQKDWSKDFNR